MFNIVTYLIWGTIKVTTIDLYNCERYDIEMLSLALTKVIEQIREFAPMVIMILNDRYNKFNMSALTHYTRMATLDGTTFLCHLDSERYEGAPGMRTVCLANVIIKKILITGANEYIPVSFLAPKEIETELSVNALMDVILTSSPSRLVICVWSHDMYYFPIASYAHFSSNSKRFMHLYPENIPDDTEVLSNVNERGSDNSGRLTMNPCSEKVLTPPAQIRPLNSSEIHSYIRPLNPPEIPRLSQCLIQNLNQLESEPIQEQENEHVSGERMIEPVGELVSEQ